MKLIRVKDTISKDPWLLEDIYPLICIGKEPPIQKWNVEQIGFKENISFLKEAYAMQGIKRIEYITKEAAEFVENVEVGKDVEFSLTRPLLLHFMEEPHLRVETELLIMPYTPKSSDCFTNSLYDSMIGYLLFPDAGMIRDISIIGKKGYLIINSYLNSATSFKISRTYFLTEEQAKQVWKNKDDSEFLDATQVKEGFLFACKYSLLLNTKNAPLSGMEGILDDGKEKGKHQEKKTEKKDVRSVPRMQVIHLSNEYKRKIKTSTGEKLDVNGLTQVKIMVSGHLRNQPCGPGGKDRKLIFIAPFEKKHWIKDGLVIRTNLV